LRRNKPPLVEVFGDAASGERYLRRIDAKMNGYDKM